MEYLQVFDYHRNILNEKVARNKKDNLPKDKYYMVVLIFIENNEGKYLLQKTSKIKHSCIATTGGHVSYKTTPLNTIVQECQEELGLNISPNNIDYVDTMIHENCHVNTYYTKMNIDINSLTLQTEEVESVNWYTEEEIFTLIKQNKFRESNIKPFKQILEYKKIMPNY